MPKVPTITHPTVRQAGAPNSFLTVQATPEDFGAAKARAMTQLGQSITQASNVGFDIVERQREEEITLQTQDLATQMETDFTEILYGQDGFFRKQGRDALEAEEPTRKTLNDYIRQKSETIQNKEVRQRFLKFANAKLRNEIEPIARHSVSEQRKHFVTLSKARQGNAIDNAVNKRGDPKEILESINDGFAAIEDAASLNGEDPTVTATKKQTFESTLHMRVIESFGETFDVEGATAYLARVRDRIDPELRDDAVKRIQTFELGRQAQLTRGIAREKEERQRIIRETGNRFFDKLQDGTLTVQEINASDIPALGAGGKREWMQLLAEGATRGKRTNPEVFNELFRRIHLPDGDPDKIENPDQVNQFIPQLSFEDTKKLRGEINGQFSPEGQQRKELRKSMFRTSRNQIAGTNTLTGIRDPKGEALYQQALADMLEEESRQRSKGELDIDSYNPKSHKFIGRVVDQYKRSTKDMLQDMRDAALGNDAGDVAEKSDTKSERLPVVRTKAEMDKLKSGTRFMGPDGKVRVKR